MEAGHVLGDRYQLAERLGTGGMAVVWAARDRVLGRTVAVKVLAARHLADPESRDRIRQEARAAATLSHPNIAQVYDYGESEVDGATAPYVVMELVRGGTLQQQITGGAMAPAEAMRICAQVAAALAAAHADGLVHRDIKPANVMITADGAKVVDFGIAAAAGEPDAEVFGTPAYLAPERLTSVTVEPASDVYALGMLLYQLLTGHSPWDIETTTQMLHAHIWVEPAPLPPVDGVPDQVVALCNRCLRKNPAERPSARDTADLLNQAATATTPSPPPRRWTRLVPAAAALSVLAVTGGWLLWPHGTARTASVLPAATVSTSVAPSPSPAGPTSTPTVPGPARRPATSAPRPTRAVPFVPAGPTTSASPRPATPTSSPAPDPTTPATRTLSSDGGTVEATCPGPGRAQLVSWTPEEPYKVKKVVPGPAAQTSVTFKHGGDRVIMTVTCHAGIPTSENAT
jgi:serine/threonine-protein kinase